MYAVSIASYFVDSLCVILLQCIVLFGLSTFYKQSLWPRYCFELLTPFQSRKFGLCDKNYTIAELLDNADARLFRFVQRPEHCRHHLLPDTVNSCSMEFDTEVVVFTFLNANITCVKVIYLSVLVQICVVTDGLCVILVMVSVHAFL